jgi:uncharacterized protein YaaW (UPF0174 family)
VSNISLHKEREKRADLFSKALANRAICMLKERYPERDVLAMIDASDRYAVIAAGGEITKINELEAVKFLANLGVLPEKVLQDISDNFTELTNKIKETFEKNV